MAGSFFSIKTPSMKYHLNAMKRQKKWISVARVKIIALSFYSHILILLKLGRPSVGRRQREREREREREKERERKGCHM